jgi:hypothetical protein
MSYNSGELKVEYKALERNYGRATVTPQVLGLHLALALHEPKHHLFIYEHGTYVE